MQLEHQVRLSGPVRDFLREVEQAANLEIQVVLDPRLNDGGPGRQGNLEIVIDAQRVQMFVPTNGYFPDGAVRHEVLHVRRFHVDGVPKLALADAQPWDEAFSTALGKLDNAIEHVIIVPAELQLHPERRMHWEAVMHDVCADLAEEPAAEGGLALCIHWVFLRHVLPGSSSTELVKRIAVEHGLLEMADGFADQFLAVAASKEGILQLLINTFPEVPWHRTALEYINSVTGTRQTPWPTDRATNA